jgi:signal peptidase I
VETVVFVVVLVLLLKSFVAEAFVIPTGSMAETLYGYQKLVTCPKCKIEFPVNCSSEVDPQQGQPTPVVGCVCPNCRYVIDFANEGMKLGWNTGDRVLVAKFLYDFDLFGMEMPKRYQVVVFKFPERPQKDYVPLNYIKRLIGLPGETIAIHYGKLYKYDGLSYLEEDKDIPWQELWYKEHMHPNDPKALELFQAGKFTILQKPPEQVLAERRLVNDNDHQAKDLIGKAKPRWRPESDDGAWTPNDPQEPKVFVHAPRANGDVSWLQYENLVPDLSNRLLVNPELITDFMGYNTWQPPRENRLRLPPQNWVGDLMIECDVEVTQAQGGLVLELRKGVNYYQARWDLASGFCTLVRGAYEKEDKLEGKEDKLESKETALRKPGKYRIRFANVDNRLIVWVDSALPFGDGVTYEPPQELGPTERDVRPVRIGVSGGGVTISHLKLWRDTYYTVNTDHPDAGADVEYSQPRWWEALRNLPVKTLYVQPDHFLCLGDNSPESSDGRMWGAVPKRLLLGRALLIYYPFKRIRAIE